MKIEHHRPGGMLQQLEIPVCKWGNISMVFIVGLSCTLGVHDIILVIMERLTKSCHILHVKATYKVANLTRLFVAEIE